MRSAPLKDGVNAAPQRALLKALGLCDDEIGRPLIGVVSSKNDIVPGHMNLDKIVDAVKQGVALGGGVPIVFPAIAVCDGLAMGHVGMKYSLVSRELIADSTEAMSIAHPFDGLVLVAACDKNVPGLLMAAARLNVPSIVVSGGAMLAGHFEGRKVSYSDISEGVSRFRTNRITPEQFLDLENNACPTCGSCSGMFTANSMNCLTEVLGLALPGNGTIPAVHSARLRLAKETGLKIMELVQPLRMLWPSIWRSDVRRIPCCICPRLRMNAASNLICPLPMRSAAVRRISVILRLRVITILKSLMKRAASERSWQKSPNWVSCIQIV